MNIQGVEILSQQVIFNTTLYGIVAVCSMVVLTVFFCVLWVLYDKEWAKFCFIICLILFIICRGLVFNDSEKAFLNYPSKIKYTIEITDDNAWKELGPNYTVKEKLYETKEIYIIEGDYVDDNT